MILRIKFVIKNILVVSISKKNIIQVETGMAITSEAIVVDRGRLAVGTDSKTLCVYTLT